MADIVIRGVDIPKPNEGAYLMQVFHDGRTIVYHYAVSGNGFGTDSQKVIETKAVSLPEGHGRLIDADVPIRVVYNDGTIHETTPSRLLCKHSLLDLPKSIVPAEGDDKE